MTIARITRRIAAALERYRYRRAGWHFDSEHWRRELCANERDEIDHIVSLRNAWECGAAAWTEQQRREFANDAANLWPIPWRLNRLKSDDTLATMSAEALAAFTPAQRRRIALVTQQVKGRYKLRVGPGERAAIVRELKFTAGGATARGSRCGGV